MYDAIAQQRGEDPREYWRRVGSANATAAAAVTRTDSATDEAPVVSVASSGLSKDPRLMRERPPVRKPRTRKQRSKRHLLEATTSLEVNLKPDREGQDAARQCEDCFEDDDILSTDGYGEADSEPESEPEPEPEPDDAQILIEFYREREPEFANPKKAAKILRAYQKKAAKAGQAAQWRGAMYDAIAQQRGEDPREYWRRVGSANATAAAVDAEAEAEAEAKSTVLGLATPQPVVTVAAAAIEALVLLATVAEPAMAEPTMAAAVATVVTEQVHEAATGAAVPAAEAEAEDTEDQYEDDFEDDDDDNDGVALE
jgi:hypothetical protein